jgi:hypothetical protein
LAEASDISLHDPTLEPVLPNSPETVPEVEEDDSEEEEGATYRSADANNAGLVVELPHMKGRYGRLPSLSGGGSAQAAALQAKAARYGVASEAESEFLTAASAANTTLNNDASDPEGINMQLQDWYR